MAITRRAFLKQGFRMGVESVSEVGEAFWTLVQSPFSSRSLVRPPGALPEDEFLEKCTRCDECVKICPPQAIMKHLEVDSRAHLTPVIDAKRQACVMCDDLPCIQVCEPGALVKAAENLGKEAP